MSKFANVQNGVVVEVFVGDVLFEMHPDFAQNWHQAPDSTAVGDTYAGGAWSKPAPVLAPSQDPTSAYVDAVQAHLDAEARTRNYDGILSACTYATSTVPKFKAEGQACVDWRDAVWSQCYTLLAQVQSGATPPPTVEALVASLPPMAWPA
jgi:hypothetical protein